MSRPITESRMASTAGFFLLPTNVRRPPAAFQPKRPCSSSFFITDILGKEESRPPSPADDDDEPILPDSDDNSKELPLVLTNQKNAGDVFVFVLDSDIGEESSASDSGGTHGALKSNKKPRKARTAFTDQQLNCLEKSFERQKYLSVQDRMELAARLNLSDTQVKTWYQNRR